jgi:hypothetical protein
MWEKTERQIKRKRKEELLDKNEVSVLMVQNVWESKILECIIFVIVSPVQLLLQLLLQFQLI